MAVSYRSYSTGNTSGTNERTITIAKPSGLAVGDLMIAFIQDNFLTKNIGGFTKLTTTVDTGISGSVYKKIATQGDVDATEYSFTFQGDGATRYAIAFLVAVYGQSSQEIASYSVNPSSSSGTSITISNAIVPFTDSLILMGIAYDNGSAVSVSNQAIATNNPSWTEIAEFKPAGFGITVAYATRPENTSTGDTTYTLSNSSTTNAILISIPYSKDFTISEAVTATSSNLGNINTEFDDSISVSDSASYQEGRYWGNESKPSTTWVNQPK